MFDSTYVFLSHSPVSLRICSSVLVVWSNPGVSTRTMRDPYRSWSKIREASRSWVTDLRPLPDRRSFSPVRVSMIFWWTFRVSENRSKFEPLKAYMTLPTSCWTYKSKEARAVKMVWWSSSKHPTQWRYRCLRTFASWSWTESFATMHSHRHLPIRFCKCA